MNKITAFKKSKKEWPKLKPSRPAMFSTIGDGKAIAVPLLDVDSVLVVYNPTDLTRLMMTCKIALLNHYPKVDRKKK